MYTRSHMWLAVSHYACFPKISHINNSSCMKLNILLECWRETWWRYTCQFQWIRIITEVVLTYKNFFLQLARFHSHLSSGSGSWWIQYVCATSTHVVVAANLKVWKEEQEFSESSRERSSFLVFQGLETYVILLPKHFYSPAYRY